MSMVTADKHMEGRVTREQAERVTRKQSYQSSTEKSGTVYVCRKQKKKYKIKLFKTISVRQAVIAARRSVMLAYGRPVYRQSQRQVLKSF